MKDRIWRLLLAAVGAMHAPGSPAALAALCAVVLAAGCAADQAGEQVDPNDFAAPHNPGSYVWNFSTGDTAVGLYASGGSAVTCSGVPASSVPDLTQHFPGRPGAIEVGTAGLRYSKPGADFATPGQCPSLRGDVDGARVYPIYVDHGHDTAALCRDKAARGGNARLLTTAAGYTDPC